MVLFFLYLSVGLSSFGLCTNCLFYPSKCYIMSYCRFPGCFAAPRGDPIRARALRQSGRSLCPRLVFVKHARYSLNTIR